MSQPGPPCLQCCLSYPLPLLINYTLIATWILDSWFVLSGGRQGCLNDRTISYLAKACSEVLTLTGWRTRRKEGWGEDTSVACMWLGLGLQNWHVLTCTGGGSIPTPRTYYCDSAVWAEAQCLDPEHLTPPTWRGNGIIRNFLSLSFGPSHTLCFPVFWQWGTRGTYTRSYRRNARLAHPPHTSLLGLQPPASSGQMDTFSTSSASVVSVLFCLSKYIIGQ